MKKLFALLLTLFCLICADQVFAAAFDFPNSPVVNQTVLGPGGQTYKWDGVKWVAVPAGAITFAGDLSGSTTTQTVVGIQTKPVPVPAAGYLHYNGTAFVWDTPSATGGGISSITAGTGLTGGTITTSGTIALSVPVTIANGGLGNTTAPSAGMINIAQSATAYAPKSVGQDATINTAGQVTVDGIWAKSIPAVASGYLHYNGTSFVWDTPASGGGFTAGGDLSGTSTAQTVVGIQGVAVPAPTSGYLWSNGTALSWQPSSGMPFVTSVTAGTGLTGGTITSTGTIALAAPVSVTNGGTGTTTAPSPAQVLVAQSATAYNAVTVSGDETMTPTGVTTNTGLKGVTVPTLAAGYLQYTGSAFAWSTPAAVTSIIAGTGLTGGTITTTGTIALSTPVSIANGGEGNATAPTAGQIRVAASATSFPPVTLSGAATISSSGVLTLTTPVTLTGTTSTVGFDFGGPVVAGSVSAFTCVIPLTIPANFASPNSVLTCGVNPAESDAYVVKVNGATVGTLTISTACVITRGTASSTTCNAGQRMEIDTPATVSGNDIAISIGVTR